MLIYSKISSNQQNFRKVSLASSFMKYLYGTPKLQTGAQKVGYLGSGTTMQLRGKRDKKKKKNKKKKKGKGKKKKHYIHAIRLASH